MCCLKLIILCSSNEVTIFINNGNCQLFAIKISRREIQAVQLGKHFDSSIWG